MEERIVVEFHPDDKHSYKYTIPDIVEISAKSINKDIEKHSSLYLWFSSLCSRLIARRDHYSACLKETMAVVELTIREKAESTGKKTTESSVKASVDIDESVLSWKKKLQEMEAEVNLCQTIKDAFYHRKDMLVTLGAQLRAEMNNGIEGIKE